MHCGIALAMWLEKIFVDAPWWKRFLISPETFILNEPGYTANEEFCSHLFLG